MGAVCIHVMFILGHWARFWALSWQQAQSECWGAWDGWSVGQFTDWLLKVGLVSQLFSADVTSGCCARRKRKCNYFFIQGYMYYGWTEERSGSKEW